MDDFFKTHPIFLETDIRKNRRGMLNGYTITEHLLTEKHLTTLPTDLVAGKSVLDLGCCVGATGGWVLDHGASEYVGVEIQEEFAEQAERNLSYYFSPDKFQIVCQGFDTFFKETTRKFDIVVSSGVLYFVVDYPSFIKSMARLGDIIFVESISPMMMRSEDLSFIKNINKLLVTQYVKNGPAVHESGANLITTMVYPSSSVIELLFDQEGFVIAEDYSEVLEKTIGPPYSPKNRFLIRFDRTKENFNLGFEAAYSSDSNTIVPWTEKANADVSVEFSPGNIRLADTINAGVQWSFDETVAKDFVQHAKKHIPDYQRVIARCVDLCSMKFDRNAKIIDVGCATGETLNQLHMAGFHNLTGVDNSQPMISKCPDYLGTLICSDNFPTSNDLYDVVLCNWTLHFINNKIPYLEDIFENMKEGGMLVLSEKTVNDGVDLELYHDFKFCRGVSKHDIEEKAKSLVDVMFINDVEWYMNTLHAVGFSRVTVINASYCFTTFLAIK